VVVVTPPRASIGDETAAASCWAASSCAAFVVATPCPDSTGSLADPVTPWLLSTGSAAVCTIPPASTGSLAVCATAWAVSSGSLAVVATPAAARRGRYERLRSMPCGDELR
jgi:hypothetical protein